MDSSEILTNNSSEKYFLWTKNNECIYFNKGHYTIISTKEGSGYFLWKLCEPIIKISFDDVDKTEIKTETDSYLIYIVIGVLAATMIVAAVLANQEFPGGN